MDQTRDATVDNNTAIDNTASVRIFNDVYLSRTTPPTTDNGRWTLFSCLPAELRLHIWLLFLQECRFIELQVSIDVDEDGQSRSYTDRNSLDRVVSGRDYTLELIGTDGRGYAAPLSPLLWVNHEARQTTLSFYRVHLPFPRYDADQVLYLNPEYDVLYVSPHIARAEPPMLLSQYSGLNPLPDFLHDVRAHDPRDQGYGKHSNCHFSSQAYCETQ
jgi:hypothetical protein